MLAAVGLIEVGTGRLGVGRPGLELLGVLAGAAGLLLRSRSPLLCLLLQAAVVAGVGKAVTASVIVGALVALGTVGRRGFTVRACLPITAADGR